MTTCQYYIKNTNNPRICNKNAPVNNTFCEQGVYGLHMCNHHFKMIQTQIINTIGRGAGPNGGFMNFAHYVTGLDEYQFAQMKSLLQFRIEEFLNESYDSDATEDDYDSDATEDELDDDEWQNILVAFDILENEAKMLENEEPQSVPFESEVNIISQQRNEKLDCPICMEQFSINKMTFLECAHSLCNDCLKEIERRNIAQKCPVCRHEF